MADTNIEWADRVWNPVTGCTKVSQGCKNCYADGVANRFWAKQYPPVLSEGCAIKTRPRRFTDVQTHADRLLEPLKWRKPARIFVNSMSDLFHEDVPFEFIDRVFAVMALAPHHTFLVLTKRPARMREYVVSRHKPHFGVRMHAILTNADSLEPTPECSWPLQNVHLGVSVENQQTADERIPLLLQTPAAIRLVSYEPALGPVDFDAPHCENCARDHEQIVPQQNGANHWCVECDSEACFGWWLGGDPGLDWIVVGGESGPRARPFNIAWARSAVRQGRHAGVSIFVKQVGSCPLVVAGEEDISYLAGVRYAASSVTLGIPAQLHLRDRKGGDPAEWPEDLRVRELPEVRA